MKKSAITLTAMAALLSATYVQAFGELNRWSTGWGQGVTEYVAVNSNGDELYIACDPYSPVSMSLTVGERSYGANSGGGFSLLIDGQEIQHPYETDSRVGSNTFYYAWEALRRANSIIAVTGDGTRVELPSKGSAKALDSTESPAFPCTTGFDL